MRVDRWLELRVRAPGADPGVLIEALLDAGGRAVYEEEGWQITHVADPGGEAAVRGCVEALRRSLGGLRDLELETRWQRQEDWETYWRRGLDVRRLTPRLVVTPSWIEPERQPGDVIIVVDPGMAFGNAEHGTTRGCLRLLDLVVSEGDRILDVGTGSAILAIAAARFGAEHVLGLEADPLALPAARENVQRNGVAERVHLHEVRAGPAYLDELGSFDGVMANLESGLLRPLLPGLAAAVRPAGWLLVSGILDHEWAGIRSELEALGCALRQVDEDGEWRSGLFAGPGKVAGTPDPG